MNHSEDITNAEADCAAVDYSGYALRHANEFDTREDSQLLRGEEGPQPPFLDPNLSRGKPQDHLFSMASLIVCFLLFVIFLIGGAAAPCKFGLCGKIDRSSTLQQTSYEVQVYDFEAPLRFAWGALAVFFLSCVMFSIYSYVLSKQGTEDGVMNEIAAYIRNESFKFLIKQLLLLSVVLVGLFVLVGVGYSMRAAGCLAFGAIAAILVCVTTIMVATSGNVRAANWIGQSRYEGATLELRTATIITVASYAFAIGGPAFSYLVFRDLRALSGYVIGAVTVALVVRISGGIFYKASSINRDPTWKGPSAYGSARNIPTVFAANTGIIVGRAVGEALQVFTAFTITVVATSILATSFPYFGENRYALCVFNHTEVDHTCTGFRQPRQKLSFAASICRANAFYRTYPSLSVWASNSAFVAAPFILGFTGVLAAIISTAYRSTPRNTDAADVDEDLTTKMRPFITRVRINVAIAAVLTIVCGAAVCFGLFGNSSAFAKENGVERDVYLIPALTPENTGTRCRPLDATRAAVVEDNDLAGVPLLEKTKRVYRTRDSFGDMFPKASETGWRLFLCVVLGVTLGVGLGIGHELIVSVSRSPSSRVAENGEFGASAVLVEGVGVSFVSTFMSFAVVVILVLGCYGLHGGYGVGICGLGMLSIAGPFCVMSLFDVISESARGIKGVVSNIDNQGRLSDGIESCGKRFASVWKVIVNSGLMIGVVGLLFVVIQESNVTPSTRQVGGSMSVGPTRHVNDIDDSSMTKIYTLVSTIIGVMGPLVFCGALTLGMSRIWHEVMGIGSKKASSQGDYHRCTQRVSNGSVVETVLPGMMSVAGGLIIGFGFGRVGLLGMLTGLISMSFLVSQALCICGGVWESGSRIVGDSDNPKWSRAMSGGRVVGRDLSEVVGPSVMLGGAEVCSISIAVVGLMASDESIWWIGVILLCVFAIVGVALILLLNARYDDVMNEMGHIIAIDTRAISPFFEHNPQI